MKNKSTKTKTFGSSFRRNHDSTDFYNSKLYNIKKPKKKKKVDYVENEVNDSILNNIFNNTSENMYMIPDNSIHLMVTSPPYNVGKDYDDDLSLSEYLELLESVFEEVYRVLVPGGRACINIANIGRKPYIPLHSYIINIMNSIGFFMRGEIIWNKNVGGGCAWGSWQSASNPVLRDQHEYILIFSKETMGRHNPNDNEDTISKEEFLEYTRSIWTFATESAKKLEHPAPFPTELPYRCIQLYSFKNEIILDPFMGVGSTAIASIEAERKYIGFETEKEYVEKSNKRIKKFLLTDQLKLKGL